jgi:hypothetical protein
VVIVDTLEIVEPGGCREQPPVLADSL